jgi:hypothetical protein
MTDHNQHALAETVFERNQRSETIEDAIKSEEERRAAVIENMRRLRALRLAREGKARTNSQASQ